jgi:two-component system sensor histidine kinase PhcS
VLDIDKDIIRYKEQLDEIRLSYTKAGCCLSIILILGGSLLDFFLYHNHVLDFLILRVIVTLANLGILVVIWKLEVKAYVRVLTWLWLVLPQLMIGWMVWKVDGPLSIYFVGLLLALYAIGVIAPLSYKEGFWFGIFTCLIYALACIFHPLFAENISEFFGKITFIAFAAIIGVVCSFFNEKSRIQTVKLQEEVAKQNADLKDSNTELVQANSILAKTKGELFEKEKMNALGTLAAGLLHEVQNPLNYSWMAVNIMLQDPAMQKVSHLQEFVDDIKDGVGRVQKIIADLKIFANQKTKTDSVTVFSLEHAINSALCLYSEELNQIKVEKVLPLDTHVIANEPAIVSVIINLFHNAVLALKQSGQKNPIIRMEGYHKGGSCHVKVWDNGTGISAGKLERVFEPFFTTRDVGKGMGMGLSVSYSIMQSYQGSLSVKSEEGLWTEFDFSLPMAFQNTSASKRVFS